jgi:hypothetical protein
VFERVIRDRERERAMLSGLVCGFSRSLPENLMVSRKESGVVHCGNGKMYGHLNVQTNIAMHLHVKKLKLALHKHTQAGERERERARVYLGFLTFYCFITKRRGKEST